MSSRIIHIAISKIISENVEIKDFNRFSVGSVIPDAAFCGNSHRKFITPDGMKKTYDLTGFRNDHLPLILGDDFYLGYYMHLVEDILFRNFIYDNYEWDPLVDGNIEKLHNDYRLTNGLIIRKYGIEDAVLPPDIPGEFGFDSCRFRASGFIELLHTDFEKRPEGEPFFFNMDMADGLIAYSAEESVREIKALRAGERYIDEFERAWRRH